MTPGQLKLRINNEYVTVAVCTVVCKHVVLCVRVHMYVCLGVCWGVQAWSGVLRLLLGLCASLWSGVDLVGLSSGAQTKPVQDYPPQDKVCDYHEKTASPSSIGKDCQACWRGGPPLISCRERLNAGAHSLPYTHTRRHNDTDARNDSHTHADALVVYACTPCIPHACTSLQQQLYIILIYAYMQKWHCCCAMQGMELLGLVRVCQWNHAKTTLIYPSIKEMHLNVFFFF